ncbi:MAG TPA: VOC family protein [Nocardioidaceae bacterium]|nr:VOC family protein [Nocardioidaceae bacterium]
MTGSRTDDCIVRPLRFTDDIPVMRGFLELLGMAPRVEAQGGGWVDMVSGAGMLALHEAASSSTSGRPGQTNLSFEGVDLDALAARLTDAGWSDATIWDEAYGRVLSVTDPSGVPIWVDGYSDDDYGYRVHVPDRDRRWSVMPVRSTANVEEYARFLGRFGLPDAGGDAPTLGGHVGLVRVESGPETVRLGFATEEPLDDVATRLRAAGHDPTVAGRQLTVVDPDGQPVVVNARP